MGTGTPEADVRTVPLHLHGAISRPSSSSPEAKQILHVRSSSASPPVTGSLSSVGRSSVVAIAGGSGVLGGGETSSSVTSLSTIRVWWFAVSSRQDMTGAAQVEPHQGLIWASKRWIRRKHRRDRRVETSRTARSDHSMSAQECGGEGAKARIVISPNSKDISLCRNTKSRV